MKDMRNAAKLATVSSRPGEWIRFSVSSAHSRSIDEWFGRINPLPPTLKREYLVQQFVRVIKISSLNTTDIEMSFVNHNERAILCVRVELPMLGRLSVYFTAGDESAPPPSSEATPKRGRDDHQEATPRAKRPRI